MIGLKTPKPGALISLQNIVKNYKTMRALDGVDLNIEPGVTGLLGPNGAGKSTLIKMLLGLVKLTSGTGTVLGQPLGSHGRQVRDLIGYMPEDDCYIPGMSGVEVVQFAASLSGLPKLEALRRAHEILDFCGMKQERYRAIDTFSTGMRQKVKFASSIVHDPQFLILDEPTSGLDPEEREALLRRIRMMWTQLGKSVLISTHILPDVQAICDEVVILSRGKIRLCESLEKLSQTSAPSYKLRIDQNESAFLVAMKQQGFDSTTTENGDLVFETNDAQFDQKTWETALQTGTRIHSIVPVKNSLEGVFMATVEEAAQAAQGAEQTRESTNANS